MQTASALLLPCAAFAGADDYDELWIVTLLAASLAAIVLVRWTVLLAAARAARSPQTRRRWRASALLVLATWMLLIQGASCPHADYLRIGPWYIFWGLPCNNVQEFTPAILWLLFDQHPHMTWTVPTAW